MTNPSPTVPHVGRAAWRVPIRRVGFTDRAGRAGALAALLMLAAQLLWRLTWSPAGVQAFPEFVVAAVARLTPLGLFGFATETFGSFAQNSLFVSVLLGVVAVGYGAGRLAASLSRRLGTGLAHRLVAGTVVATGLLLFAFLVVLPIAYLGVFARDSSYTREILLQLVSTFALFGVAWALLAAPPAVAGAGSASSPVIARRAVLRGAARAGLALTALGTVGGATWRLIRPNPTGDAAADAQRARDILTAAQAGGAGPKPPAAGPVPTSAAVPPPPDPVSSRLVAAAPDASARFAQLDVEGKLTPLLTPTPDFYHVSKNISDPTVSADGWSLEVTGLVDREIRLSHADLLARATDQKITTLGCISNELNGDLIGTAQWSGFPLATLLAEAGVQPGAVDLKFHCSDDYEDSIPVAQGMDPDTLVVVGMNGELLTPDHGFPARMIVPGIYGMKNVKWLERIEVVDEDFKGYWQTRGWSDPAPNQIWARIDTPASGQKLEPGAAVAAGVASAGDRGISRVEVSLDDGETWADATLEPALNAPFTWIRWAFPFEAVPGKHKLVVRPTDGTGQVADKKRRSPLPDGATGWPSRGVQVKG